MKAFKRWQGLLRWIVTLGALAYFVSRVDVRELAAHVVAAELRWIAFSVTLSVGVIIFMGLRWRCVLRACDLQVPLSQTVSVTFIGQFFNSFLPGSTGGDIVKAWYATKWAPERKAAPVISIFYDRLTAIVTLLMATTVVLGVQAASRPDLRWLFARFLLLGSGVAIAAGFLAAVARTFRSKLPQIVGGDHPIQQFCRTHFGNCRFSTNALNEFSAAVVVSVAAHLLNVTAAWGIARAVHLEVGFLQLAVAVAFVNFSSVLPISIGGHGVREAGFVFIFTLYNIIPRGGAHDAVMENVLAFSLLLFARSLMSSLPGGLCYTIFRRERGSAAPAAIPQSFSCAEGSIS